MAASKPPFFVVEEFLSPKQCEYIVDMLGCISPDLNNKNNPVKMVKLDKDLEQIVFERLQSIVPNIESYYDFKYKGTERMAFEWFPEGFKDPECVCENSSYLRKKWVRTRSRDLTGVLFLSNFRDSAPFDSEYEVYGGKLEFPQHNFSFHPSRGQLIIYPSGPHFINANSEVLIGDMHQIRFHITGAMPYLYNPEKFPGNYKSWFMNKS
jgi:hypothetical protein